MISLIRGKVAFKSSTEVVVDCGGVGYGASISVITSGKLPAIGEEVTLLTVLIPREDALNLFAFADDAEREAFKLLKSVTGIGPKSALGILSSITINELQTYVLGNNLTALQKLPGIGKKTAERLIVELKDKLAKMKDYPLAAFPQSPEKLLYQEAIAALIALGYNNSSAEKSVKKVIAESAGKDSSLEEIIRLSLREAMGN